jgi:hypothetical protein
MKLFKDWHFKWWEVSLLKLCMLSLGIFLGVYFYECLSRLIYLWIFLFVLITFYFIITIFFKK